MNSAKPAGRPRWLRASGEPGRRPKDRRFRPSFEALDERLLLSTFVVDHVADDGLPGSLRAAIGQANVQPGADTITFSLPAGATIILASDLPTITDDLTIRGPGAAALTLDGAGAFRPFDVRFVTFTLSGLTVANAAATTAGGALTSNGTTTVAGCVFQNDSSTVAGGAIAEANLFLNVAASTFTQNTAPTGGAIALSSEATGTIDSSTLANNQSTADGGAVAAFQAGNATIVNSTLSGNKSGGSGGAISGDASSLLTISHSTISGNNASTAGGGIAQRAGPVIQLDYTIVAGNTQGSKGPPTRSDIAGTVADGSTFNLVGDGTGLAGIVQGFNGNQVGSAKQPIDPLLGPLANNGGPTQTMALLAGSPALDAGNPSYAGSPSLDQRGPGFTRFFGAAPDIGAYEAQGGIIASNLSVPAAVEAQPLVNVPVFHFTDANAIATPANFVATVKPGDGNTLTSAANPTAVTVVAGNGGFDVQLSYTFADELKGSFQVSVLDLGNNSTVTANGSITVADAALTAGALTVPAPVVEGTPLASVVVFHFTDSNAGATPADFLATVQPGDGSTFTSAANPAAVQVVAGGGGFDVRLTYTYAEELTGGTFSVTVQDVGGAPPISVNGPISVADAPLTAGPLTVPAAVEGIPLVNVIVFHFTDANPGATSADFTATVDPGDGTPLLLSSVNPAAVQIVASAGGFDVQLSHTYAEELKSATFSVTVKDKGGALPLLVNGPLTVADAALTAGALSVPAPVEGMALTKVVVFHFSDANPAATPADFVATVKPGDGTTLTSLANPGAVQVVASSGGFDVQLSYTYAEEFPGGTFSVLVQDVGGAAPIFAANPISVADAALTAGALTVPAATEAVPLANVVVFHFTDANPGATVADFVATIKPADGATLTSLANPGAVQVVASSGGFDVQLSYTYAEELSGGTFRVSAQDVGGAPPITANAPISVADALLTAGALTVPAAVEGAPLAKVVVFHFTDANPGATPADFVATVKPGDGSTLTSLANPAAVQVVASAGGFDVQFSYIYAEDLPGGTFSVTVQDVGGAPPISANGPISVADASLTAGALTAPSTVEGVPLAKVVVFHFTDANPGATAADVVATVKPGDGATLTSLANPGAVQVVASSGGFDVQLSYTYAEELSGGTFSISVQDVDGAPPISAHAPITVADALLTAGALTVPAAVEGAPLAKVVVFHFTDVNPAAAAADFVATIKPGDGSTLTSLANPAAVQVVANAGGFDVLLNYTYAEDFAGGTFSVAVQDVGGAPPLAVNGPISVADAALTAGALTVPAAVEGAPLAKVAVFHFTDANPGATPADFVATVKPGDGSTLTSLANPAAVQVVANAGGIDVLLSYTYAEELAAGTFSVTVQDVGGAPPLSANGPVTVADAALTAGVLTVPATVEGTALANVAVFHFTDANPGATAADFVATIKPGDGSTLTSLANPAAVQVSASGGGFDVRLSYSYAEELPGGTFSVSVQDVGGAPPIGANGPITVADALLTAGTLSVPAAVEGAPLAKVVVLHFTDANPAAAAADFVATIKPGDGSTLTSLANPAAVQVVANAGGFDVLLNYTYAEDFAGGTFSVAVQDVGGAPPLAVNGPISVADAALTAGALTVPAAVEGAPLAKVAVFHFTDANPGATPADFVATVKPGDGSTLTSLANPAAVQVVANAGSFDVLLCYTYAEELAAGTFSVAVQDVGGAPPLSANGPVTVADAALTGGSLSVPTAIEDVPLANVVVLHFSDANPSATAADFVATIKPGDGATLTSLVNPAAVQVVASAGGFDVRLSYSYAEELPGGTFTVSVQDVGGAPPVGANGPITVADALLTAGAFTVPAAVEGAPLANMVVLHFTDVNPAAAAVDFVATIKPGDGSTLTSLANPGAVQVVASGGGFDVQLSYTYAEDFVGGTFSVSVQDIGGAAPLFAAGPIGVADAALTGGALTVPVATEGIPLPNVVVFHFTDANPGATVADFVATIKPGDGATLTSLANPAAVQVVASAGGFDVRLSYTYADELPGGTFRVSVQDVGGAPPITANGPISGADAPLAAGALTVPTALEGAPLAKVVVFHFTDANPGATPADFVATVKPGDGSTLSSITNPATVQVVANAGGFDVLLSYSYTEELTAGTFSVAVQDVGGAPPLSANGPITVADAALAAGALTVPAAIEGVPLGNIVVFHFTDANPGAAATDFVASVKLGDGASLTSLANPTAVQVVASAGGFDVHLSYTYAEELVGGTVSVTVQDLGGAPPLSANGSITVADASLTAGSLTVPAAVEGAPLAKVVVFHFSDANPGATAADFVATVQPGDGNPVTSLANPAAVQVVANAGGFDVLLSYTYAEDFVGGTFSIAVQDVGGAPPLAVNGPISVADAALTARVLTVPAAVEGAPLAKVVVFHFTDANPGARPADFVASVKPGDGNTLTSVANPAAVQVVANAGGFDVQLSYTYTEELTAATFSVSVQDVGGAPLITANGPIRVADAALTAGSLTVPAAIEGAPLANLVVFHFTDANPAATAADFLATVEPGDGTTQTSAANPGAVQVVANAGGFDIALRYTYAEELKAGTFRVAVQDLGGAPPIAANGPISVTDAPLTAGALTVPAAVEAAPLANVAVFHFTDTNPGAAAADFVATIQPGDGSTLTSLANPAAVQVIASGGGFDVRLSYVYAEEVASGSFSVTVQDVGGAPPISVNGPISVADAPLTAGPLTVPAAVEGIPLVNAVVFHFTDANPGATSADFTATVDPGDGTPLLLSSVNPAAVQIVASAGGFDVQLSHTYAEELKSATFSVTVQDKGGALPLLVSGLLTVADAPLTAGTLTVPAPVEGAALANVVVFHFSDANPAAAPADFVAAVQPGDGSTRTSAANPAAVQVVANAGSFDVQLSYTYAEEFTGGTFRVLVADIGGAPPIGASGPISAADAALTAGALTVPAAVEAAPLQNTAVFHFSDANPAATPLDFLATVQPGVGSTLSSAANPTAVQIRANAGGFDVLLSYTYAEEVAGTFTVSVRDMGGAGPVGASAAVTVADAQLTALGLVVPSVVAGVPVQDVVVYRFSDANATAVPGDFVATVQPGDDSTLTNLANPANVQVTAGSNGSFAVRLSYSYQQAITAGTFTVSVIDVGGSGPIGNHAPIMIPAATPTPPVATPPAATVTPPAPTAPAATPPVATPPVVPTAPAVVSPPVVPAPPPAAAAILGQQSDIPTAFYTVVLGRTVPVSPARPLLFAAVAPSLAVIPIVLPITALLTLEPTFPNLGGVRELGERPFVLYREGIAEALINDIRPPFTPRTLTPLRPLHALPAMAAAFDAGERVEFVTRLYREAGSGASATALPATYVARPSAEAPAPPEATTTPPELPEPAETARPSSATTLLTSVGAALALCIAGCAWVVRRTWRTPPRPTVAQRDAASGGPIKTKGAQ